MQSLEEINIWYYVPFQQHIYKIIFPNCRIDPFKNKWIFSAWNPIPYLFK